MNKLVKYFVAPVLLLAAGLGSAAASAQTSSVSIQNFAFSPSSVSVSQGATVTWVNKDNTAHTVTGDTAGGPASGQLQPNQSYSFTFKNAGTFAYHCSIHPDMKGSVTVAAAQSAQSTTQATAQPSGSTPTPTATPVPSNIPGTGADIIGIVALLALAGAGAYYLRTRKKTN